MSNTRSGPPVDDLTGLLLAGRYRLNRHIASGGMAMVWEGTDETLARRVAVKILHRHLAGDDSFVERFRAEAVAAARLTHPSIVSVYDTVTDQGLNAIVMELVVGTTMRADLDQHGPMDLRAVLAIGSQVADALGAAHASGLVHRDVKPANILLAADGRVLVADFGIAKASQGSDLTTDGSMVGTAKYLAPEQVEGGPIDGRADIYALGIVLYEALTGTPPFVADNDAGTALARLHRAPVPPRTLRPQIPEGVEQVVLRALALRPDDRFDDAATMRRALLGAGANPAHASVAAQNAVAAASGERPAVDHQQAPSWPSPAGNDHGYDDPSDEMGQPRRRRWPWLLATIAVMAIIAGVAAGVLIDRSEAPRPLPTLATVDFDPQGDNAETAGQLPFLTDDDPTTSWRTERYGDATFADLPDKSGVGVYLKVADTARLDSLTLVTPTGGWAAQIHVVDGEPPTDLEGWGEPVTHIDSAPTGTQKVKLGNVRGKAVLIWFTTLVPYEDKFAVHIGDVVLEGS